jgi:LPXTG-motif cell wall-anchored protein
MRTRILSGAAIGVAALALVATPAAAATDGAKLSVLHGVPGLTVDVYVNNALTLDDFEPGDLAGPLDLPAGTYSVAITAADAADASAPAIGPVDLTLAAGGDYTAVAHLTEAGQPSATLFTNDITQTAPGEGRLTVRHVAAAPAVDVLAGGSAVISGLANPNEQVLNLPAGTVNASVAAAGTTAPVIGPADVNVAEGANTIVYAWGSLQSNNLAFAVQTIEGLHSAPHGIPAGSAGLAAESESNTLWLGVAGLLGLLAAAALLIRRRVAPVRR